MTTRRSQLAAGALMVLALATVSHAQGQTNDARWNAWIGCWLAVAVDPPAPATSGTVVCVSPTASASAVELAIIERGSVVARDTIDASGVRRSSDAQGCSSLSSAEWSQDTRRVYLRSETACGSAATRTSTGVFAMLRTGEWLAIHTVSAGAGSSVRTTRYREVTRRSADLPGEFAAIDTGLSAFAIYNARTFAAADVGPAEVIEAASKVDSLAVQAWIAERRQPFDLDAAALTALADGGVAGAVTDVMVAVTYPQLFRVGRSAAAPELPARGATDVVYGQGMAPRYMPGGCDPRDPVRNSAFNTCPYGHDYYGYYGYSYYGFNPYGYGYDWYYAPYRSGGYYTPVVYTPIVVSRQSDPPHGRVVKGRGYTADYDWGSTGSSSSGSSTSRASSSSGSSSSGSSSSGSSSGSNTGRTAQKKGGGE